MRNSFIILGSIALTAAATACGSDDPADWAVGSASAKTLANIKEVFPAKRVETTSFEFFGTFDQSFTYDGDLLKDYTYVDSGAEHPYTLVWHEDRIDIYREGKQTQIACFGESGNVEEIKVNPEKGLWYTQDKLYYDPLNRLVKMEYTPYTLGTTTYTLKWTDGNLTEWTSHYYTVNEFTDKRTDYYKTRSFTFNSVTNKAAVTPLGNDFFDRAYLSALYYAGVLGKGSVNLVKETYTDGELLYSYEYELNSEGYPGIVHQIPPEHSGTPDGTCYYLYD